MLNKNNLIEGPIVKSLFALSVPIILANIFQTLYQLTDTFWVGRLGADAVAAVSLSFPIIFLLISLGGGLTIAGTILVAQYKGKNDKKNVDYISAQTLLMVVFVSILVSVIGYFSSPHLIKLMGAEESVLPGAVSYLQISFIGIIFVFSYFVFQSLMRGVGDVKKPMYIVLGTVVLNFILDPLLIFGYKIIPGIGVGGAAISTIVCEGLAAIIGITMLFSGKYDIHLRKNNFKPDWRLIKKMFNLGFPSSIEQSARSLGFTFMTFLAASFGTMVIASYGIGTRILSFIIIPSIGLSMATSTLVGQNIGAGKIERAEKISKISSILSFVVLTVIGIFFFIFAAPIAKLFIPGDALVIQNSASFIRIMALTFGFIGIQMVINGVFRGAGSTYTTMVLSIISLWVLNLPVAYFLSKYTSLSYSGIWWSFPISNIAAAIIAYIWFLRGTWKKKKITEEFKMREEVAEEVIVEEGMQS